MLKVEADQILTVQAGCLSLSLMHTHIHTHFDTLSGSVLVVLNEPGQAKVSDLAHQIVSDKNVCCSQVTVDVVHPLNVRHSSCNLRQTQRHRKSSDGW